MTTYLIHDKLEVETGHPLHGTITLKFKPGKHTPHSEQEEIVLQLLVSNDQAELVPEVPTHARTKAVKKTVKKQTATKPVPPMADPQVQVQASKVWDAALEGVTIHPDQGDS